MKEQNDSKTVTLARQYDAAQSAVKAARTKYNHAKRVLDTAKIEAEHAAIHLHAYTGGGFRDL